jgi:dienelactone hydrolase
MSQKLTRRQLALAAAAAAALPQQQSQAASESSYTGALDGFKDKVDLEAFDSLSWTQKRYQEMPLKLTFKATDAQQAQEWQKALKAKLIELIGGFPPQRSPLNAQTLEVRDFPSYRREKFIFQSRPGLFVLGYLLTPAQGQAPHCAVICLPGHGRGVDDIVGIDDKGQPRTDKAGYQHDFALQVVEHGMAAVAIEQLAFGCRRDERTRARNLGTSSCQPSAGAAFLMGETMIGWRVYDVMRTIDWLETRPEIDAKRVGCMGISGGGTITTFASALEPRIRAALISGYLNTFRDSVFSIAHCIDNYVPGILEWCEMYDVAALIAPRPLFSESGERDNIFPVAATRASFERVQKIYALFGKPELAGQEIFDDEHVFHGKRGLPFLAQHL